MMGDVPYLIDVGQGLLVEHQMADEFLKRDARNILNYFKRNYGIEKDEEEVLRWIKGRPK
jgi:serine/threonine-protein kinase RIO1